MGGGAAHGRTASQSSRRLTDPPVPFQINSTDRTDLVFFLNRK